MRRTVSEATDTRSCQQLAGVALNDLQDNPEDAVYAAWQESATVPERGDAVHPESLAESYGEQGSADPEV